MIVLMVTTDLLAASQLEGAARAAGAELKTIAPAKLEEALDPPPSLVVFELGGKLDGLDQKVQAIKSQAPKAGIVAFAPHIQGETLAAAQQAGCHMVIYRSKLQQAAPELIKRYVSPSE